MSAIVGSFSSAAGGSATVIAGNKPLRCSFFLRKLPLFLEIVRNETSFASNKCTALVIRASAVDSYENSSDFVKRVEMAWIISQQPRPVACSSCASKGHVECKWCGGTGFFVLGDNMLCEFPSKNTSCVICAGKGSACCADCKGTGFRAKWLEKLPPL